MNGDCSAGQPITAAAVLPALSFDRAPQVSRHACRLDDSLQVAQLGRRSPKPLADAMRYRPAGKETFPRERWHRVGRCSAAGFRPSSKKNRFLVELVH